MKTFDLSHDTLNGLSKKLLAFHHKLEQKSPVHFHFSLNVDSASLKPLKKYMAGVISEGLKQNLLGNDINMEFLMLTARSYSQLLAGTVAKRLVRKRNFKFSVTQPTNLVS